MKSFNTLDGTLVIVMQRHNPRDGFMTCDTTGSDTIYWDRNGICRSDFLLSFNPNPKKNIKNDFNRLSFDDRLLINDYLRMDDHVHAAQAYINARRNRSDNLFVLGMMALAIALFTALTLSFS